jgi:iron-sulfur cluster assembly accessory protein
MVEISPTAIREIKRLQTNRENSARCLRLAVRTGGCSGLFYNLKFEELETASREENSSLSDRSLEIDGIVLKIDVESWQYIEHLKLDYSEDLMGGGFRFNNPQIKSSCGCGISFSAA